MLTHRIYLLEFINVMFTQWENECVSLSVLSVALALHWQCISRDYPWLITRAALYTGLGEPKARTTAETMVKSEMAPT